MKQPKLLSLLLAVVTIVVFFLFLLPLVWMFLSSFKTQVDIMSAKNFLHFKPTVENYQSVFQNYNFLQFMINSFLVASGTTLLSLLMGLPAGYAIARNKYHRLAAVILVARMIPPITFLIPWFLLFSKLHLVDTYGGLILCNMVVVLPFIVWIMIPNFESVPEDIESAGMIDGCSRTKIFLRLVLPVARPGIITASLMSFIFTWNNFLFSVIFAGDKTKTLPVAVFNFMSYSNIDWGGLMAAASVITLPILVIAMFAHRYIISGLSAGVSK